MWFWSQKVTSSRASLRFALGFARIISSTPCFLLALIIQLFVASLKLSFVPIILKPSAGLFVNSFTSGSLAFSSPIIIIEFWPWPRDSSNLWNSLMMILAVIVNVIARTHAASTMNLDSNISWLKNTTVKTSIMPVEMAYIMLTISSRIARRFIV